MGFGLYKIRNGRISQISIEWPIEFIFFWNKCLSKKCDSIDVKNTIGFYLGIIANRLLQIRKYFDMAQKRQEKVIRCFDYTISALKPASKSMVQRGLRSS